MLSTTISLAVLNVLAIQNITIYESDIVSNDATFDFPTTLELILLLLLIIPAIFLFNKINQKYFKSQSPVQELQNRMEILETIVVSSVETSEDVTFDSGE